MSQIVRGLTNNGLREKLLRTVDLSLQCCIQICKASEIVRLQADEISGATNTATKVTVKCMPYKNRRDQHKRSTNGSYQDNQNTNDTFLCNRCGVTHKRRECPAYGKKCTKCDKLNHFVRSCRQTDSVQKKTVGTVNYGEQFDDHTIDSVYSIYKNRDDLFESLEINGRNIPCKLDTGVWINVLSEKTTEVCWTDQHFTRTTVNSQAVTIHQYTPSGNVLLRLYRE